MTVLVANARMYAVTPAAEVAWQALIGHVADEAGVALAYLPYPAPQPMEPLWRRPDVGCVLMCGYPLAMRLADVEPIAAPIPAVSWAGGRAVYRSDLIVRADEPAQSLADMDERRVGWTVEHSHSGFNALRHHLLTRRHGRQRAFRESVGSLVTARKILDSVVVGSIDVGPLDAYWHLLLARHAPDLVAGIRVLESTDTAPMPAFVAGPAVGAEARESLARAFVAARDRPWFPALAQALCLKGFEAVTRATYDPTLAWRDEAEAAGYLVPA